MLSRSSLTAAAAAAGLSSIASAGIETVRFDLPGGPIGIYGREWFQDYAEPARIGTVVGARLHIEFDTSHPFGDFHDAADILVQIQLPTTTVPFWNVQGSDLGWSGLGRFSDDISTDAFNGEELLYDSTVPLHGQLVFWFGRIVSANDDQQLLGGEFINSYWEFDLDVVPAPGVPILLGLGVAACARRRRA